MNTKNNSNFYKNKNILVTGGTGLIGQPLVQMLSELGAKVTVVSLDSPERAPKNVEFIKADLREFKNCLEVCANKNIVFNLVGVKGSPAMTAKQPASFFVPTITFNTNMMEAARRCGVERYLYTSSIGVYEPADIFYEDSVWTTFPSPNDRFAGWAKRMGELQAEAYKIEYNWDKISIVRPANVYGPFDNFDPNNAMVIPSLIKRVLDGESPLTVWGDGTPVRDFIYSADVANGMLLAVEQGINTPINLGSGTGVSIKQIAEIITDYASELLDHKIDIKWDTSKPSGDKLRLMDTKKAESYNIKPEVSLETGIKNTIDWYINNKEHIDNRYNAFLENNNSK